MYGNVEKRIQTYGRPLRVLERAGESSRRLTPVDVVVHHLVALPRGPVRLALVPLLLLLPMMVAMVVVMMVMKMMFMVKTVGVASCAAKHRCHVARRLRVRHASIMIGKLEIVRR